MKNGLLNTEVALIKAEANEVLRDFMGDLRRKTYIHARACGEFFLNEATEFAAVRDTRVVPTSSPKETILVGKWKWDENSRVYLRHGLESEALGILIQYSRDTKPLLYRIRTDNLAAGNGFLDADESSPRAISLALPLIDRVVAGVRGYEHVMQSRGLK